MKKDEIIMIPFVTHESAMNRMERANRRLWIVIILMFIGMLIYFLLPNEVVEDTQTVDDTTNNGEITQTIGDK